MNINKLLFNNSIISGLCWEINWSLVFRTSPSKYWEWKNARKNNEKCKKKKTNNFVIRDRPRITGFPVHHLPITQLSSYIITVITSGCKWDVNNHCIDTIASLGWLNDWTLILHNVVIKHCLHARCKMINNCSLIPDHFVIKHLLYARSKKSKNGSLILDNVVMQHCLHARCKMINNCSLIPDNVVIKHSFNARCKMTKQLISNIR